MERQSVIYLDHAATLPYKKYLPVYGRDELNPNAGYVAYSSYIKDMEQKIIGALNLSDGIVVFTQNASHSASILAELASDKEAWLEVGHDAHASIFDYRDVGVMEKWNEITVWTPVNNVTGEIMNKPICYDFLAADLTSTIGRLYLDEDTMRDVDFAWLSGHKIGSVGGILYLSRRAMALFGCNESYHNNHGLFHGTMDLAAFSALARAICSIKVTNQYITNDLAKELNRRNIPFSVCGNNTVPTIGCFSVGVDASMLQNYLAQNNIYIGLGSSACDMGIDTRVLESFGVSQSEALEYFRVSLPVFADHSLPTNWASVLAEGIENFNKEFKI